MSLTAAAIRLMASKGMTAEDIADIAEAMEKPLPDLSAAALRTRKWREKKQASPGDVTVTHHGDASPLSLETKVSPTPLSKTQTLSPSKNPPKGGQKGSRLPENWRPDESGLAYAAETLGPDVDPERELDRFLDYWRAVPGAKGLKLDWPATWRNWCRTAAERLPRARKAHERPDHDAKFAAKQANYERAFAGSELAIGRRWQP